MKKLNKNQVALHKIESHKGFISSIAFVIEAAVNTVPIPKAKNIHIFLAGLISLGLVLLACVLKAHIDALRQG